MKSTNFKWLALSLCLFFALSSTKNKTNADQNTSIKAFSEYLGDSITIDLKGTVLGTNQNPIENAKISIDNTSAFTDSLGQFTLKNVFVHKNLLVINVAKNGFKTELINLSSKDETRAVNITLYKNSELSLFWFNKNNHNLPHSSSK